MKFFRKRSVWVLITTYIFSWFVVSLIAGNVLESFKKNINTALNLTGTRTEVIDEEEEDEQDKEYFKSDYVVDGQVTTDENGYTHQTYDDVGLRNATTAKAEETQSEGSVLLWNSSNNGLPLSKGNKVSVFSHNSVDWLCSGAGSGASQVNANSTVLSEFTAAGLSVNETLWNFYKSGAGSGSTYTRQGNWKMNEVPWSLVNSNCSSSFSSYKDAAIIIYSRLTRESSNGGNGGDATKTQADTATGDYFELSNEEKDLLNNVIALKNSGTFKKVIVLLNTPAGMFMDSFVANKSKIDCLLWVGFTGYQGLHEVGKMLVGDSTPSGRLADTFAYHTGSAPSSVNIEAKKYTNASSAGFRSESQQGAYLTYAENIYVGYKYYETRYEDTVLNQGNASSTAGVKKSSGNWKYKEEVAFPFGYGASYTTFALSNFECVKNTDGDYDVTLKVKNTGEKKGKDVVEVYVQRPYTAYDKENAIEQSSVNLAGYLKTKELNPNEEISVKITVRDDAFKTYDANNKKTYIREKTSGADAYYITAAHDAHEAINNILAKKGKTPSNTSNRMDANGDASFVQQFDFAEDDFTTYAVSEYTGKPITNQFDDVDWNKYEHKTEGNVKYLSRSNWRDTYPTATISLSLNAEMIVDLGDTHAVSANPGDTMPSYNQTPQYSLIDLMGVPYEDERWYALVDQLSIDDQIRLLGSAYFGTIALSTIGKPADVAGDGPLGLKRSFKYNTSIRTMSYPSPTIMAASFNDQLAYDIGALMGEDALHSGATGIYAPGVNIHRSMYGARNWEYHSEDGFLSGMIGKWRVIGSQTKGCYVHMKHFALNDQESYRHGVGVWANEQSIREVYLNAYEYAATEGNCSGFMTSFVRFGTYWSGAHKGLCTGIVRDEWGVKGFIVSDSAWQKYMGVVDGVLAGNDCILYNVDLSMYDIAKTNPTVARAVRESVKRILYVVGNSNAMNGISTGVRIYEVREWWQILVSNVQKALGIVAGTFLILTALRFLFNKKLNQERVFNEAVRNNEVPAKGKKPVKKKHAFGILFTGASLLAVAVAIIISPFQMESIRASLATDNEETIPLRDRLEEGASLYKIEGESALIETNISQLRTDYEGRTAAETNYPSGTGFVACVNKEGTASLTYQFTAGEEKQAVFGVCMGRREYSLNLASMYTIYVNGKKVAMKYTNVVFPEMEANGVRYYDWMEMDIMMIDLKEGMNSITFTKVDGAQKILNLDYIYVVTNTVVVPETRTYNTYTFDCNQGSDPFISSHGGSVQDENSTYTTEGSAGLYRYGNCNDGIFTTTVVCEEETMAILKLINDCRPDRTFSSKQTSGANPYIASLTVNGSSKGIILSSQSYPSQGWNNYFQSSLASIKLEAGENVIVFKIGGDNINICGIAVCAPIQIKLKGQGGNSSGAYKFEAENADIVTNIAELGADYEGRTPAQTNNPSGTGFIHNANKTGDLTITFNFTALADGTATLGACFGRREYELAIYSMYKIEVNGVEHTTGNITIPVMKEGGVKYYDWFEQDICSINIKSGANTIVFTKIANAPRMLNFDYIYLNTSVELSGILTSYKFNVNDAFDPSIENNDHNPFVAANGGSAVDSNKDYQSENGGPYRYGNGNDAVLTVTISVSQATTVAFKLINDCRPLQSPGTGASIFSYTQQPQTNKNPNPFISSMTVNDSTAGIVPSTKTYTSKGWNVFMECELATINLKKGANVIVFKIGGDNINYCGIVVDSPVPVTLGSAS